MKLSESEEKFLLKLEKGLKRAYIVYISVGISLCGAIVCLVMGIVRGSEKSFDDALLCAVLGSSLFSITYAYRKMFKIVSKMKKTIEDLEKGHNGEASTN